MSQSFVSPFTGTVIEPTDVSYYPLTLTQNTPLFWPAVVNQQLGEVPASRIMDVTPADNSFTITTNTTTTFTIAGNQTADFVNGVSVVFSQTVGSTTYTVSSSAYVGSNTVVTFTPALPLSTIVGTAWINLIIMLPDATQGSLGSDIFFRNLGSSQFVVQDATGDNGRTIPPGVTVYFYLTVNNTDAGGTWGNITLGTGTSAADAATLAGAGLSTYNGQLVTTQNIVDTTVTPSITQTSLASTFVWNGGVGTFNLPNVLTLTAGWFIGFRNNGTGSLTITPVSPTTINNAASIVANPGDSGFIVYDVNTGNYLTVGLTAPSNTIFTSGTYDVDAISGSTFSLVSFAPIIQTYIAQSGSRTTSLLVQLPAITQLYVFYNNTNQSGYNIEFQILGSSQTPISLGTGSVVTVLSTGTDLYVLTQTSSTVFYAQNGNQADPSYSFLSDGATGMYLDGTSILGLTANSIEMLRIDNSNTLNPKVSTPATFNAGLIAGGTF
jgi:hypothetical protein